MARGWIHRGCAPIPDATADAPPARTGVCAEDGRRIPAFEGIEGVEDFPSDDTRQRLRAWLNSFTP